MPLTPKGKKIMKSMKKTYGKKKAEQVFYASKNKGKIKNVDKKKQKIMAGKGLYANIHAKRRRGGKMRKKGAKGAPTAANFARAKQTARKR